LKERHLLSETMFRVVEMVKYQTSTLWTSNNNGLPRGELFNTFSAVNRQNRQAKSTATDRWTFEPPRHWRCAFLKYHRYQQERQCACINDRRDAQYLTADGAARNMAATTLVARRRKRTMTAWRFGVNKATR